MRLSGSLLHHGIRLTLVALWCVAASAAAGAPSTPVEKVDCEGLAQVRSLLQENRLEAAIEALKRVLGSDPSCAEAHMLLGIAYRSTGSFDLIGEAKAELRQALALNPGLVWARHYLARLYLDFDRKERAREELETALRQVPEHPHFLALLGEVHRQLDDPELSARLNRQALQKDPELLPARYYLGLSLLDLGSLEEAVRELEAAAASDQAIGEVHLSLGSAYLRAGRTERAVDTLKRGLEMDPSRPDGRVDLARAYRLQELFEPALEQLRLALPEGAPIFASPYYQRVEVDVHFETGRIRKKQERLEEAVASFQRVIHLDPSHESAHRQLAELFLLTGEEEKSRQHAQLAAELAASDGTSREP